MKKILLFVWATLCIYNSNAQPTAGLVAYWPMNGNFNDGGAYAINGTNNGSTATTNAAGMVNTAMNFSNPGASTVVPQFATHPVNANLSFGTNQDFTIDFSVFVTSLPHPGGIYDNNLNYGGPGVFVWNANGFPQLIFNFKNGSVLTTNGALPLNVWKHVACVRAGAVTQIYIDGVLNATAAPGTWVPVYSFPARFGSMFYNGYTPPQYNGHNGKIDEMRIYSRALTAVEIAGLAVLPVKLNSFTATKTNDDVLLQWQTEYEQNSSHFNIQRSIDGISYNNIALVNAAGNTATMSNYQYMDNTAKSIAAGKTVYYRLEEVDKDGRKKLSDIILVKYGSSSKLLTLLQNPVTDAVRLQINIPVKQNVSLLITNAAGQQVLQKNIVLNTGQNFMTLPVSNLAKGLYTITLISPTADKQSLPFIK